MGSQRTQDKFLIIDNHTAHINLFQHCDDYVLNVDYIFYQKVCLFKEYSDAMSFYDEAEIEELAKIDQDPLENLYLHHNGMYKEFCMCLN